MKTLLDELEKNTLKNPDKILFMEKDHEISYQDFCKLAKRIAYSLKDIHNQPIAIYMDKSIECLASMFGVLYSGNYYTIIDTKMPNDRIELILDILKPVYVITKDKNKEQITGQKLIYETIIENQQEYDVHKEIMDTDLMYVLFTSGSTGIPKGVMISHGACYSYIQWFTTCFQINESTIFGSGTPLYFSMSVSDLYGTIMGDATFVIIPKMYFSFPVKLLEYMNEKKINTTYWVPSAYQIVANYHALDDTKLPYYHHLLFAGEVMNTKVLNNWIHHCKLKTVANLFGPTETTDICTYYKITKPLLDTDIIPIGIPCEGLEIKIIHDELYVTGPFLADGYLHNEEKTKETFVTIDHKIYYKTGDLVHYNDHKELIYDGRCDFQIKHLGYRIELGEIENNVNNLDGIINNVCIYEHNNIYLYFEGTLSEMDVLEKLKEKVPSYMVPEMIVKIDKMKYNLNGKIDRHYYQEISKEKK